VAAGIPGTGIGGLFYALLALMMPLRRLFARGRRPAMTWRAVFRAGALLAGIVGAMWATGAVVRLVVPDSDRSGRALNAIGAIGTTVPVLEATLLASALSLVLVLTTVQVLRVLAHRRRPKAAGPAERASRSDEFES
jgi:hypothetical protein